MGTSVPGMCCNVMSLRVSWYFFYLYNTNLGDIFSQLLVAQSLACWTSQGTQRRNIARMPWNFVCMVMQHVPESESNVKPIRDNDHKSLCLCTEKNKIAAISILLLLLFDWNHSFCFFVYLNTELFKAVPPRFDPMTELAYPWNKQSAYVSGYYSKKCDCCLQDF